MNKNRMSLENRYKLASLEEKRTVLELLFDAYTQSIEGAIPKALKTLANVTSLLGPSTDVNKIIRMMQDGNIDKAREDLTFLIKQAIKNMKPISGREEWRDE